MEPGTNDACVNKRPGSTGQWQALSLTEEKKFQGFNRVMTEWTFMTALHYCWSSFTVLTQCNHSFFVCGRGSTVYRGHDYINVKEKTKNILISVRIFLLNFSIELNRDQETKE